VGGLLAAAWGTWYFFLWSAEQAVAATEGFSLLEQTPSSDAYASNNYSGDTGDDVEYENHTLEGDPNDESVSDIQSANVGAAKNRWRSVDKKRPSRVLSKKKR
jgi:hypothetical protein